MPIIKSARKRVRTAKKAHVRNYKTKRSMREAIKSFVKVLDGGKPAEIGKAQAEAMSAIDKAAKKNIIHKNKAAREKARLAARAKAASSKTTKSASQKTAAKKPAAKKVSPTKLSKKVSAGKAKKPASKK